MTTPDEGMEWTRPQPSPDFPDPGQTEHTPRRAKPARELGTDIILVACCMIAGLIGGFTGTVLASLW